MAISNIKSRWVDGELVFYDKATMTEIFRIKDGTTGGPTIGVGQALVGSRFAVSVNSIVAATATTPFPFFVAPAPCKFIKGRFNAAVAAATASYMQVEKLINTVAMGAGAVAQANSFALVNTANYEQTDTPSATGTQYQLTTGDRLALKFDTANVTTLAGGVLTVYLEWT